MEIAECGKWGVVTCVAGVEGEGKGKKRAREVRDEGAREAREGRSFSPPLLPFRAPFGPFPPILRPATQAGGV